MKKLLIACYYYPPYPGIGGRRTAKFASELARQGYQLYVVGAKNPFAKASIWTEESRHPNISYHPIDSKYPEILLAPDDRELRKTSLWDRIRYRWATFYYRQIQPLRIFDGSFRMEEPYRKKLAELIEGEGISNIMVSVSPHYYAYFTARLKEENYPNINLIIDFRDPWLSMSNFGIGAMSPTQREAEREIIEYTISKCDSIISPSEFVLDEFREYLGKNASAVEVLHPYDPKEIAPFVEKSTYRRGPKIRFVYGGTLYEDLVDALQTLKEVLDILKEKNPEIYQKLEFIFYANEDEFIPLFKEHSEVLTFSKPIGKTIISKIFQADYVMMLYTEFSKNFRSTKFYAYLPARRPYFYLGPKGDTYRFIEEEGIGVAFEQKREKEKLLKFLLNVESHLDTYSPSLDFHAFSIENQAKKIIDLLK